MRRLRPLLVAALALTAPGAAAQGALDDTTAWEPLGDARQQARAFGFSGDRDAPTLWNGFTGIYRLDEIDGAWVRVDGWPSDGPILFLGDPFDEAGPDTLLVGVGLYRSVDGGQTFVRVESPAGGSDGRVGPNGALDQFPYDSPYPGRLVSGDGRETVYSDDGGDTWTRSEPSVQYQGFRLHTFRSGRVIAAGFYGAVLSRDGGQTYEPIPALYGPGSAPQFDLTEMVMLDGFVTGQPGDSEEGRLIITGTQAGRPSTYAWATDDEGETWRELHAFEHGARHPVAAVPASVGGAPGWAVSTDGLPGRVWVTTDGGETWDRIGRVPGVGANSDGSFTIAMTVEVGPDGRLYAGTARSGNKASWSYRSRARLADLMGPVSSEGPPEAASLGLSVFPNPSGGTVTVRLGRASGAIRVSVVDVLGREVAVVHDGPARDGQRVAVDTAGWPVGAYTVRVEAEAGGTSAGLTVVR